MAYEWMVYFKHRCKTMEPYGQYEHEIGEYALVVLLLCVRGVRRARHVVAEQFVKIILAKPWFQRKAFAREINTNECSMVVLWDGKGARVPIGWWLVANSCCE